MAIRFRIGKFRLRGIRFPKWGVRGNLFAAFGVIAGMAIVISAGAAIVLAQLGNTMVDLSGRDIPRLAAKQLAKEGVDAIMVIGTSLTFYRGYEAHQDLLEQLRRETGLPVSTMTEAVDVGLAGQGPALLASRSEESLSERSRKMKETQAIALQKLGEIIELGADKTVVAALTETVKNIDEMIQSLGSAARERLETAALHEKQYDTLGKAQAAFVAASAPAMMDAQGQLNAILSSADPSSDDATRAARTVEQLGNVIASGNLMASNMAAALSATNSDTLEAIEKEFKETLDQVK